MKNFWLFLITTCGVLFHIATAVADQFEYIGNADSTCAVNSYTYELADHAPTLRAGNLGTFRIKFDLDNRNWSFLGYFTEIVRSDPTHELFPYTGVIIRDVKRVAQ